MVTRHNFLKSLVANGGIVTSVENAKVSPVGKNVQSSNRDFLLEFPELWLLKYYKIIVSLFLYDWLLKRV